MNLIVQKLSEQDSRFISVMNLADEIAGKTGGDRNDAITFLYRSLMQKAIEFESYNQLPTLYHYDKANGWTQRSYEGTKVLETLKEYILAPESGTPCKVEIAYGVEGPGFAANLYELGFERNRIIDLLVSSGLELNPNSKEERDSPVVMPPKFPDWAAELSAIEWFTKIQAVYLLAGVNPFDIEKLWFGDLNSKEEVALTLIEQALDANLLETRNGKSDTIEISHRALRAWAPNVGRNWCIPPSVLKEPVQPHESSSPLVEKIDKLSHENHELQTKLAEAEAKLAKSESVSSENTELKSKLATMASDMGTLKAEVSNLKNDALQGKTKTTLLKLVGGMAEAIYKVGIHNTSMEVQDLLGDLEKVGAGVHPDTLRRVLREAANHIDKPEIGKG